MKKSTLTYLLKLILAVVAVCALGALFVSATFGAQPPYTGAPRSRDQWLPSDPLGMAQLKYLADRDAGALAADAANAAAIVVETNRAQVAEGLLSNAVIAETNRAQVAEGLLSDAIDLRPTFGQSTNIAEAVVAPWTNYVASNRIWVDWRNDSSTADGSFYRPYKTVQDALNAIGSAADTNAYMVVTCRYYTVEVAPGIYAENLTIPFRPHIALELRGAVVDGNVSRTVPEWPNVPLNSRLVIRGDSMRAGYSAEYPVVGVSGTITYAGSTAQGMDAGPFHVLEIDRAYVGAIEFGAGNQQWAHVFMDCAQVGLIVATNSWNGASLFVYGWGMGHTGGGPDQQGIGPLIGKVLPYYLQNTSVNGMELSGSWLNAGEYMLWHNVQFETNGTYNVSNVLYGVHLDRASYNSWAAASAGQEPGSWALGNKMSLTDALEASPTFTSILFPQGDLFYSDGTNLFYVSADGAYTNALTTNGE